MNEIRKNTESEKILATANCKMPKLYIALYIVFIVIHSLMMIVGLVLLVKIGSAEAFVFGLLLLTLTVLCFILHISALKKSKCIVTNKRIYGTKVAFIARKNFSYRLDMIDNVEVSNSLGVNRLVVSFSQGNGKQIVVQPGIINKSMYDDNTFSMGCIEKIDEFYNAVTQVLMSVKNDRDTDVDIEVKKIEAQEKQAAAFSKIAENMSGKPTNQSEVKDDYISQLHRLKQLLDNGVITQQEFEIKKKELLG